ncbi:hypothetical protein [Burkholderia pseudomultivorans]|uniref:Lipoprotein n=1 Tax=Burkholderia pseudomultivorans TaxID=1207504 RepID=A0ABU2ED40_9BURK|nr:hypothetical protein [Burkholderia pseudomultivorans]MDR8731316.1 hypothetical protein [Burkholderia pseudomultivorans]MDR8738937.1 hypothetical protein [Burkholderia pseudomultivorans]MDR8745488.1 hypothetical protein [Burkholderia pseudomultivorans]MDR8757810.1 hypothetical protein [Burkholderia pseudomultivorans]MDR8781910.1 hypothetical protein [Burkholderia pseudomultivorans]
MEKSVVEGDRKAVTLEQAQRQAADRQRQEAADRQRQQAEVQRQAREAAPVRDGAQRAAEQAKARAANRMMGRAIE